MKNFIYYMLLGFLISISTIVSANEAEADADDACKKYFSYLKSNDFKGVVQLYSKKDLQRLRDYFLTSLANAQGFEKRQIKEITGTDSVEALAKYKNEELIEMLLRPTLQKLAAEVGLGNYQILGKVSEGDALVHFLIKNSATVSNVKIDLITVQTYKKFEGHWYSTIDQMLEYKIKTALGN